MDVDETRAIGTEPEREAEAGAGNETMLSEAPPVTQPEAPTEASMPQPEVQPQQPETQPEQPEIQPEQAETVNSTNQPPVSAVLEPVTDAAPVTDATAPVTDATAPVSDYSQAETSIHPVSESSAPPATETSHPVSDSSAPLAAETSSTPAVSTKDTTVLVSADSAQPADTPTDTPRATPKPEATPPAESKHSYGTRSKDRSKEEEARQRSLAKQKAANVVVKPRLKPVAYAASDAPTAHDGRTPASAVADTQFYVTDDSVPLNKRGFKYKPCAPQPQFPANLYATTDTAPYGVHLSVFDRAQALEVDETLTKATTAQGWRSVRTNVGIREGRFYFEFVVVSAHEGGGHARVGIARKEANLEAPVGFDGYSYGLRDVNGELMTLSRPQGTYLDGGFTTGDVIGVLVDLPPLAEHRRAVAEFIASKAGPLPKKAPAKKGKKPTGPDTAAFVAHGNIARDQVPINYKHGLYFEQYEYTPTKAMEHLLNPVSMVGERAVVENETNNRLSENLPRIPRSRVRFFKNGVESAQRLEELYSFLPTEVSTANVGYNTAQAQNPDYRQTDDGSLGYYPMVSCFQGAVVELNAGPEFRYPVGDEARPLCERFDESVVESWYWDLVDEVEAEYLDSFE
ncbi:hypothetical protein DICA0_B05314 [Diutina catenulata]